MTDATNLTQSATETLAYMVELLAGGFTGTVKVECMDGGVRFVATEQTLRPHEIHKRGLKQAS